MNPREKYFEEIGEQLSYNEWARYIFFYPTGDGLRLSIVGQTIMSIHYPSYTVDSKSEFDSVPGREVRKSKHYIFLARFCRKPYYISRDQIIFFDEEEAFLFKLCDGDIDNVQEVAPERLK